ncbi:MAG: hypothetical protein GKR98_15140 [Boseongicola sp.]|nr:MAG: hypothetical protein GKR98_15140 [Boseongicola sp.]
MKKAVFALSVVCFPFAAVASEDDQLVQREDCSPLYTVQQKGCQATHVLQCQYQGDTIYRFENIEDGALVGIDFETDDFDFLAEWSPTGERTIHGIVANTNPFSFSEMMETGQDTFDQTALVDFQIGLPRESTIVGQMFRTGEVIDVSGFALERVEFDLTMGVGGLAMEIVGDMFIDRLTNTLFDGGGVMTSGGFSMELPGEPVRMLREGDLGFMKNITLFGCGEES